MNLTKFIHTKKIKQFNSISKTLLTIATCYCNLGKIFCHCFSNNDMKNNSHQETYKSHKLNNTLKEFLYFDKDLIVLC